MCKSVDGVVTVGLNLRTGKKEEREKKLNPDVFIVWSGGLAFSGEWGGWVGWVRRAGWAI